MKTEMKSLRLSEYEVSEVLAGLDNVELNNKIADQLLDQLPQSERGPLAEGRDHLTAEGLFRSDKYPWSGDGLVPLKVTDEMAWPMLRAYAAAREGKDLEFTRDLDEALDNAGAPSMSDFLAQGEGEEDVSPRAIADMMTALVGMHKQAEVDTGLSPLADDSRIRRKEIEDEVLRLSRKVK